MARRGNRQNYNRNPRGNKLSKNQKTEVKRIADRTIKKSYPIQQDISTYNKTPTNVYQGTKMFESLLGIILPKSNALETLPMYNVPGDDYRRLKIMITGCYVTLLVRGGEGNVILPPDLYSTVRLRCVWSNATFSEFPVHNSPTTVIAPFDARDSERVYFDKVFYLPTITFDPSGYAVPSQKTFRKFIKINRIIDCFSISDTDTTTDWDTKKGTMMMYCWSDSAVVPHPTITGTYTFYYKYMM